ncbi:MAG: zinc-binding dehydrogenase [Polyangiales bacterium]
MRAVVIAGPGGYDRLQITSRPSPTPRPGEVRVRAEAIGVNYADCIVRMGLYASAKKYVGWPITPGFELAGVVDALGEGVTDLAVGAPVMAVTRFGGYATEVVVPRGQVFARPAGFGAAEAAAFPSVSLTAWFALFALAHPRPGDRVLVHSAAGGVGSALVQLARVAGAEVIGVVGASHKVEAVRALGADHVIDRSREDLWRRVEAIAPQGVEVILDANGADSLRASWAHLGAPGKLVVYGFHTMLPRGGGRPSWPRLLWTWLRTPRFDPSR